MNARAYRLVVLAALAVLTLGLPACKGPYKAGLRDLAMEPSERVADRVGGMVESAGRAAQSVRAAAALTVRATEGAALSARGARLINEAEAEAFEFARQELIVLDVLGADPSAAGLRDAMAEMRTLLERAVAALRDAQQGAPQHADALRSSSAAVDASLGQLRAAAEFLLPGSAHSPVYRSR